MIVVVDSNIIVSDFFLRGIGFKSLEASFGRIPSKLIVPHLVIEEVKKKFREEISSVIKHIGQLRRVLYNLSISEDDLKSQIEAYPALLESLLRAKTRDSFEISNYPKIGIERIVDKSIGGQKPFTPDGKQGFRDAIIWEFVKDIVSRFPREDIIFVTQNTKDFSDPQEKRRLHPQLQKDIDTLQSSEQEFHYLTDLSEISLFLEKETNIPTNLVDRMTDAIEANRESLNDQLSKDLEGSRYIPSEGETPHITYFENPELIDIKDIRRVSDNELLVISEAEFDAQIEFFMWKTDYYAYEDEEFSVEDSDWNDHYILASTQKMLPVKLEMIYDLTKGSVTNISADLHPPEAATRANAS